MGGADDPFDDLPPVGKGEQRVQARRKLDRRIYHMAQQALNSATKATEAIDRHIEECATNYNHMATILKWIVGILGTGTLLIITALGAVAWALFEYILSNPRLLAP